MNGVDLSHYQDGLNLLQVKNAGYSFAILKVSEGRGLADSSFDKFYGMAQANGIPVGAYVYSHATSAVDAREEARFALTTLKGRPLQLGIYMDIETTSQMQIPKSQLIEVAKAFMSVITAAGYGFGIYSSEYGAWTRFSPEDFADATIWVAHYGQRPQIPCDLWQKTDRGAIPGYYGAVDVDEVMSDKFAKMVEPPEEEEPVDTTGNDANWDWKIADIQVPMKADGYWPHDVDGKKSPEFFEWLDKYVADMKNC